MCTRQRSFRGDATSLLSVEWSSRDTTGSCFARSVACLGGTHGARALDAFGLEPAEGRRALAASSARPPTSTATRRRRHRNPHRRRASTTVPTRVPPRLPARGARLRRARVPLRVRRLRVMRGWDYRGFAQQGSDGVRTVEGALFSARSARLIAPDAAPETSRTRGGRTDAGVSALGQIVRCGSARSGERKGGNEGRKRTKVLIRGRDAASTSTAPAKTRKTRRPSRFERRPPRGAFRFDNPPPGGAFSRSTRRMSWTTALY